MFNPLRSVTILMVVGLVLVTISAAPQASSYDVELLRLTNFVRQKAGLPALRLSTRLGQVALNHARDMAANNYFSHTGLNGSQSWDRAKAAGYHYSYIAENISAGHATPRKTILSWMNSPGHRKNILNPNYTEIGFGYAYSNASKYKYYWVQVFGRPSRGKYSSGSPQSRRQSLPIIRQPRQSTCYYSRTQKRRICPSKKSRPSPRQSQRYKYCASGNVNINNMSRSCSNGRCKTSGVKMTCNNRMCQWCNANNRCGKILYNGTTYISGGSINCRNGQCNYSVRNGGSSSSGNFYCRGRRS
jgi:hypothetical protein